MRPLTLVLPFYENPAMLLEQGRIWQQYPEDLKAQLHVIVVDDGSPRPAVPLEGTGLASFHLFRTREDVRWNWLFCRNLGVAKAETEWVLLTDIDHVLPMTTLRTLVHTKLDPQAVYRCSRVDAPHPWPWSDQVLVPYKPHPNTWLLTRAMFDRIGGYDERFSGYYGTDADFRDRVTATAARVVLRSECLVRYPRDVIPDASTTTYGRKEEQDRIHVARIRNERAHVPDWRPKRLTFAYDQVV